MNDERNIAEVTEEVVANFGQGRDLVVPILEGIQDRLHYLPPEAIQKVCELTQITPSQIEGVATFYPQFRFTPAGRHNVRVCIGTACHVKGAEQVYDAFCDFLNVPESGDTDPEGMFTVSKVACLGCCMLAPAVQIDDLTYGFVRTDGVGKVLVDFLEEQKSAPETGPATVEARTVEGKVLICLCSSCVAGGALNVYRELNRQIELMRLPVEVENVGCTGVSYQAPLVKIVVKGGSQFSYGMMHADDVRRLLLRHFKPAAPGPRIRSVITGFLERIYTDRAREPVTRYFVATGHGADPGFSQGQVHIATEHCGELNPLDMDSYINNGGFEAFEKCLKDLSGSEIVQIIIASGLRGRGGAGFSTGLKWKNVRDAPCNEKYVICNGDEGDPGAFMDRMIIESFPFRVIEGILIAACAVGASKAFIYLRYEYPLALKRMEEAIEKCRRAGYLANSVTGPNRSLVFEIRMGAGAFVCGEETALIQAIEGNRGTPRYRPPYPSEQGLWGKPTLINNVETMALVPWIIRNGAKSFMGIGTEKSKGTKTFALAGRIRRGGLIEAPMGMTLRQIVEEIGGGVENGGKLKAVQVGGPSGGCIPEALCDTPVDYEALIEHGAMMGSGGMVVFDQTDCMVEVARYFLSFTRNESCGKCVFCRVGARKMLEILEDLCDGKATGDDLAMLETLAWQVKDGSLCGLGRSAPNPVLSTLLHFREEYEAHIEGECPAGKCKALITYRITDECIGCTRCAQRCPADAIKIKPYQQHEIDEEKCVRCDTCRKVCPAEAVVVDTGRKKPGKAV